MADILSQPQCGKDSLNSRDFSIECDEYCFFYNQMEYVIN